MKFELDPQNLQRTKYILSNITMPHVKEDSIFCVKSWGSKSNAIARIYSFPRPLQLALNSSPKYVIEIISEKFDKLTEENKDKVLIHELMHIPKTFSGALVPHKCFGKKRVCSKTVEIVYQEFKSKI